MSKTIYISKTSLGKEAERLVISFEQGTSQFLVPSQEDIYVNINGINFSLDRCSEATEKMKKIIGALRFYALDEEGGNIAREALKECGL